MSNIRYHPVVQKLNFGTDTIYNMDEEDLCMVRTGFSIHT